MYRAKVQAVSGKNVFADGKWLTCIGNKPVHVGEMIWTDGRCVYGNQKEAQQPLVITAPREEDEGIPIIMSNGDCYSFIKGKLKSVGTVAESCVLITNDAKGKVLLYDYANHSQDVTYLLASNLDNSGNRSDMVMCYETDHDEDGDAFLREDRIEIRKNGNVLKTISLSDLTNKYLQNVPQLTEYDVNETGIRTITNTLFRIHDEPFIESENNWFFVLYFNASQTYDFIGSPDDSEPFDVRLEESDYTCYILLDQSGDHIILERKFYGLAEDYLYDIPEEIILDETIKNNFDKIPLHNGYYHSMTFLDSSNNDDMFMLKHTFFSPDNKEICSLISPLTINSGIGNFLITKNRNSYLVGVNVPFLLDDKTPQRNGLYLYDGNSFTQILQGNFINEKLLRMKKIKNWQKRIKDI